ncbi:MAG: hypothetical protein ACK5NG_05635 [Chthoniobacterales bacterium]
MKIRIINSAGAPYLEEILTAGGLCFSQVGSLEQVMAEVKAEEDILILPADAGADAEEEGFRFLRSGGRVLAVRPGAKLLDQVGLTCRKSHESFAWLRFVRRVCPGGRGEPLWMRGGFDFYEPGVHDTPEMRIMLRKRKMMPR